MSIINDALKKADYLKRWKSNSGPPSAQDSATAVETTESPEVETKPSASPAVTTQEISVDSVIGAGTTSASKSPSAPFRIVFDPQKSSDQAFTQISKVVLISFIACGFFVLLFGPWFFIWTSGQPVPTFVQTVQPAPRLAVVPVEPVRPPVEPVENLQSIPEALVTPAVKPTQSGEVKMSVMPIPKMFKKIPIEERYKLTGITILGDQDRLAFINGKVLRVGDNIEDIVVTVIDKDRVIIKKGMKQFTLEID